MRKYSSRIDFQRNSPNPCSQARNRDWYKDFAQEIWGDPLEPGGYKKSDFIKACERNNNGLGILYLIKCFMGNEWFYKAGITSLGSVAERYKHDGFRPNTAMPYNYEIMWTIKGEGGQIWDLEKEYHRNTKQHRYQPELWGRKSLETFKCHGNCKILRKLESSSQQKTLLSVQT